MRISRWLVTRGIIGQLVAAVSISSALWAQQATVTGRVMDASGTQPVPSALVQVQDSDTRVLSGSDGRFAITVPDLNARLVVTAFGFSTDSVALNGQQEIVVLLRAGAVELSELVVVGYGTQRRSDVTGSVSSVRPERLQDQPNANVAQALQGAVPGVTVTTAGAGAEPNMRMLIRGQKSITASTSPLVVIDGIPYNGTLAEINQADISTIDVLKDASASAIYGARGSNGVILITTKKGSGMPRITYNGYVGAQQVAHLPDMMDGPQFAAFKCQRLTAVATGAAADLCDETALLARLTPTEREHYVGGLQTDWVDVATHTGIQHQHDLSVSGSIGDTRYYLGGTVLDIGGVARNDEFRRYTLRLNLDQTLHTWIQLGTSTHLGLTDRGGIPASFGNAFRGNPLTSPFDADGTISVYPWPEDPVYSNPLQGLLALNDDRAQRVFTSNFAQVDFPFLDGLSYRVNAGLDFSNREQGTYYGRNTLTGVAVQGQASTSNTTRNDWTLENILRYTRSFGAHNLDLTSLYGAQWSGQERQALTAFGFPTDVLTYRQANTATQLTPSNDVTEWRLLSQMGRLNYTYDERYLLTLTARRDGYSGFGANHKYGVFPSAALGWNVSNEGFWNEESLVNLLRLRLSWGRNGNQAVNPYQTLARLQEFPYIEDSRASAGFLTATLGNPDLRWETTTQVNLGIEFALALNRVMGSVDLYDSRTKDLLLNRAISPVHGISGVLTNMGRTRNRGVELSLSTTNIEGNDFGWTSDFNIAANRNAILDLYGNGEDDIGNRWFIGHPVDVNYGYQFDGIFQTDDNIAGSAQPTAKPGDVRIRDINGDGRIGPEDRVIQGSLQPSYVAGLTNSLRYKNLSLTFLLTSVQGLNRPNPELDGEAVLADVRRNMPNLNWWAPSNPNTTVPANREAANALGVEFYENASFTRLRDVNLSYTPPGSVTDRLGLQSLRLYVNGQNLWTHANWTGLDPELDNSQQRGIPLARVFVVGANVSF